MQILTDESTGKLFIASDFNRIGQSYRSPWSNVYLPTTHDADALYFPPEQLRRIELTLNELLLSYCNLYYENAVGSTYLSEAPEGGVFYGVFQIRKDFADPHTKESHCWESNHSFRVNSKVDHDLLQVECFMTSTVLTVFEFADAELPSHLNGSSSKAGTRSFTIFRKDIDTYEEVLVKTLGELMEDNENSIRGMMDKVAIPRCTELAMASFGLGNNGDDEYSGDSSDAMEDDYRPRVSLGTMNPLHRQSTRPVPAFQADLLGAISQRRIREQDRAEGS